jgi:hypothetical protein
MTGAQGVVCLISEMGTTTSMGISKNLIHVPSGMMYTHILLLYILNSATLLLQNILSNTKGQIGYMCPVYLTIYFTL